MIRLTHVVPVVGLLSCAFLVTVAPAQEIAREDALKDAEAMEALCNEFGSAFRGIDGSEMVRETTEEGMLAKCEKSLAQLEAVEKDVLPKLQPPMAGFATKYLPEDTEMENPAAIAMAVTNRFFDLGVKPRDLDRDVGDCFSDLYQGMANVVKSRKASAVYLGDYVKDMPDPSFYVEDKRAQIMGTWKTILQWAVKFDPDNEYANARIATIDGEIDAVATALEADIDAKTWAGHMAGFPGPGEVGALASTAVEYLRNDRDWGKAEKPSEVLAVAVTGPWEVAETNILGQILSWRLPVHVAVTKPELKERGVARVYELSMVGKIGAGKAPPFDGFWVGDSWMMRLSKVPEPQ